jgi:hypothetical protein
MAGSRRHRFGQACRDRTNEWSGSSRRRPELDWKKDQIGRVRSSTFGTRRLSLIAEAIIALCLTLKAKNVSREEAFSENFSTNHQ